MAVVWQIPNIPRLDKLVIPAHSRFSNLATFQAALAPCIAFLASSAVSGGSVGLEGRVIGLEAKSGLAWSGLAIRGVPRLCMARDRGQEGMGSRLERLRDSGRGVWGLEWWGGAFLLGGVVPDILVSCGSTGRSVAVSLASTPLPRASSS